MKSNTILIFIICVCSQAIAQIGGRATYQFLNLETSARHAALGGKLVTDFQNNPIGGLYNPATINPKMAKNYALNYINYIEDINYGSAATAFRLGKSSDKVLHVGVIYADYGDFEGFDLIGNETGTFGASETAISVGYAQPIADTPFRIGISAKVISSQLEQYSSFGIAADFGILYKKEDKDLTIGLSVRNLGTQITTYAGTKEDLPLEIDAGISNIPEHIPVRWFISLQNLQFWDIAFSNSNLNKEDVFGQSEQIDDPSFFNNALRHVNLGIELFPKKAVNLRLGYNFRRSEELKVADQRSFAGLSGGFAVRIKRLTFNYTFARYNAAASASLFGLNLNFGDYK